MCPNNVSVTPASQMEINVNSRAMAVVTVVVLGLHYLDEIYTQ